MKTKLYFQTFWSTLTLFSISNISELAIKKNSQQWLRKQSIYLSFQMKALFELDYLNGACLPELVELLFIFIGILAII